MKYLVTGAAGFIGSSITDRLLAGGNEVIGVDNYSTGLREFLSDAITHANFTLVEGDLLEPSLLLPYLLNVDAVFHMAANADIRDGLINPRKDLEQNTLATFNVLEAMRESSVRKIIFSSTAAALGEPVDFPTPENCPIPAQTSLYGASKMACEGLISAYCQGYGFEGYIFRFVSVLGPRYPHGHVFDFVNKLRKNKSHLLILGDGSQRKSYLHIADCLDALLHIPNANSSTIRSGGQYEVFHLGFPGYCRVEDSARWICSELGLSPKFEFSGGDRGWIGDNPFVFLDVGKAKAAGWSPRYTIEQSIRETTRWLSDNSWIFALRNPSRE